MPDGFFPRTHCISTACAIRFRTRGNSRAIKNRILCDLDIPNWLWENLESSGLRSCTDSSRSITVRSQNTNHFQGFTFLKCDSDSGCLFPDSCWAMDRRTIPRSSRVDTAKYQSFRFLSRKLAIHKAAHVNSELTHHLPSLEIYSTEICTSLQYLVWLSCPKAPLLVFDR
jgi:hypothetical protein